MRTLEAAPSRSKIGLLHPGVSLARADPANGLPRPSWSVLIIATSVVAGLTWGIARQRTHEIDPRQVIAVNLTAAQLAVEDARFVEPAEHSAAYYYRMVLAIDPTNEAARTGLNAVAEALLGEAKRAVLRERFADAVQAVDHARRIAPEHRRIPFVEAQLNRALEARAASVKAARQSHEVASAADDTKPVRESVAQKPIAPSQARVISEPPVAKTRETEADDGHVVGDDAQTLAARIDEVSASPQGVPTVPSQPEQPEQPEQTFQQYVAIDTAYQIARSTLATTPNPAVSSSESPPITVSAGRVAPKIVSLVEPEYPKSARVRGIEGWVDLLLSVDASGHVIAARVDEAKGAKSFERAALSAVRQWRYEATSANRAPQDVPVRVEFRMEK